MNQHQSLEAVLDSDVVVIVDDDDWHLFASDDDPSPSAVVYDENDFGANRAEAWAEDDGWVETSVMVGSRNPGRARRRATTKKVLVLAGVVVTAAGAYFGFVYAPQSSSPEETAREISVSPDSILAHLPLDPTPALGEAVEDVDPGPALPPTNPPLTSEAELPPTESEGSGFPSVVITENPDESSSETSLPDGGSSQSASISAMLDGLFRETNRHRRPTLARRLESEEIEAKRAANEAPSITIDGKVYALDKGETIVQLANGSRFRGQVKKIRDGKITLTQGQGEFTFEIGELSAILGTDIPELRPFELLPKARVTLENGARFSGRVARDNQTEVVLKTETGAMSFPRDQVARLSYLEPNQPSVMPVPNQSREAWEKAVPKPVDSLRKIGPLTDWAPGTGIRSIEEDSDRVSDVQIVGDWKKRSKDE